jgi:hypothetical protein
MIHVLHTPMEEVTREPNGEPRYCFRCRKVQPFAYVVSRPIDRMSYYGPSARIECAACHLVDGDMFPGRWREWGEA